MAFSGLFVSATFAVTFDFVCEGLSVATGNTLGPVESVAATCMVALSVNFVSQFAVSYLNSSFTDRSERVFGTSLPHISFCTSTTVPPPGVPINTRIWTAESQNFASHTSKKSKPSCRISAFKYTYFVPNSFLFLHGRLFVGKRSLHRLFGCNHSRVHIFPACLSNARLQRNGKAGVCVHTLLLLVEPFCIYTLAGTPTCAWQIVCRLRVSTNAHEKLTQVE